MDLLTQIIQKDDIIVNTMKYIGNLSLMRNVILLRYLINYILKERVQYIDTPIDKSIQIVELLTKHFS